MADPAADLEAYDAAPGVEQDERAHDHRRRALEALDGGDAQVALVQAVLALEARVDELTYWIAAR
jgi:hypothetical protein